MNKTDELRFFEAIVQVPEVDRQCLGTVDEHHEHNNNNNNYIISLSAIHSTAGRAALCVFLVVFQLHSSHEVERSGMNF